MVAQYRRAKGDRNWFHKHPRRLSLIPRSFTVPQGICIRDIKPENTLLDKHGCVRISDFGASKTERYHSKPNTKCGTHPFMAPEVRLK